MWYSLCKYLPELIIFVLDLLYVLARWMTDLGYLSVPEWVLDIDVPNISLTLLSFIIIFKYLEGNDASQTRSH